MQAARDGDEEVKAEIARADRWCDDACQKWYGERRRQEPHWGEAIAAGQNRSGKARELIHQWLEKKPADVPAIARATLLQTLSDVDAQAAGKLAIEMLREPHPLTRAAACEAILGNPQPGAAASLLAMMLGDKSALVRTAAARSLLQIPTDQHPTSIGPKLQQAVRDWSPVSRPITIARVRT